ncbi:MAG: Maf family protein [Cyanobacteriota bacterium]|jgi:septum formation protein
MLLLASASPARRRLLEQAAIPHRVRVSGVAEDDIQETDPARLAQRLARAKAMAVRDRLTAADGEIQAVLGCDSLLVVKGEVFGKPADAAEASERWRRMAGGWGELLTGHCLLPWSSRAAIAPGIPEGSGEPSREWITTVTTRVHFAALSEAEIAAYVASGEPLQCAGGFALEGRGGLVVEGIEGCCSNVIGLSLPLLRRWLLDLDRVREKQTNRDWNRSRE